MSKDKKDSSKERKRGAFSTEELKFIDTNRNLLTVAAMAEKLNRSEQVVAKQLELITDKANTTINKENAKSAQSDLRTKVYWPQIKKQYDAEELLLYVSHWSELLKQFDNDVTYAEEMQICRLIDLSMQLDRNLKEKMTVEKEIGIIHKQIDKETSEDPVVQDKDYIQSLMQTLAGLRSSQMTRSNEYTTLLDKHSKLLTSLKSTRDQRFTEIHNRKVTFLGWIKAFEDANSRERYSHQAEILALAAENSQDELSQLHTYADGELDLPLLNSDTVDALDKRQKEPTKEVKGEIDEQE